MIVDALRSPITTAEIDGPISDPSVGNVLTQIFDGLIRRSGVDPNSVDNGVVACGGVGRDWVEIVARDAWRKEGRTNPVTITGVSAGGSQDVHTAMQRLRSDNSQLVIAGGVDCSPLPVEHTTNPIKSSKPKPQRSYRSNTSSRASNSTTTLRGHIGEQPL